MTSSINAPAKKNGAGGSYTWGISAQDDIDFMPAAFGVAGANVSIMAAAPATPNEEGWLLVDAEPKEAFQGNLMDDKEFPTLAGRGVPAQPSIPEVEQGIRTSPQVQAVPSPARKVVAKSDQLRPGSEDLFDASHPRNRFACKPTTTLPASTPSSSQMAIDWSNSGIPLEVNRSLVKSGNSAHLGLYQQAAATRIPTEYLRPATAPVQASRSHRVQLQGKPPMVKQMFAKGSRGQRS
eukprot:gnl/MRDRNA2_/MRDRNA2_82350_c0_seq2.p1 gnl/MRDRNA2_/MRDRNA2_82350_c0~~gnl/MRDRNA2_/MRDRNA2_82350_c0_seq2.p1  ORF type:complete len:278 (+),score=45.01 gnl/MRDRNA2_/MRDRNA2_82350_c0_seq2:125-835(+)